jgi:hypothetical protein
MRVLLATAFLIFAPQLLWAADAPASDASVRKLIETTHVRELLDAAQAQLVESMRAGMHQALADQNVTAEQQKILDEMQVQMTAILMEEISWDKLEPMLVGLYATTFTQREINGMLAFYRTAAGTALITKMPVVMQKSMEKTQARMATALPKLQQLQRDTVVKLTAAAEKSTAPQ